ncbi:AtpZ/AtpI family protein [Paenarthrobacter sp. Z7-10]|uniref:AtpZ/AtpI family protein n=1 Tax=Paenarthrobacter sp. Z7-10 TaxID=2787635 RepID=UPI0022A9E680|nr:AtpZ/AtpI family protein [Paenarthrobacter sp. Z7-10]
MSAEERTGAGASPEPGDSGKTSIAASGSASRNGTGGYNAGMAVFSYIIGGILVWSLIGWGLDILLHASWFVLIGAFVGLAGGFYLSFAQRLHRHRSGNAAGPREAQDRSDSGQS